MIRRTAPGRSSGPSSGRVLDPLALRVLDGDFREGDTIVVDAGAGGLAFEKKQETVKVVSGVAR